METIFAIILSGLLATLFWITVMFTFSWKGFHHGDMIGVVGSDITKDPKLYFSRGILLYLITGMVMAPVYYFVLSWIAFQGVVFNMGFSAFMGISQGFLLMHLFVEEPAQHHPPPLLQKFLIPVSVGHWLGHMAYGVAVGALISSFILYSWDGLSISGLVVLLISLVVSYFVFKGAHREALQEKQANNQPISDADQQ